MPNEAVSYDAKQYRFELPLKNPGQLRQYLKLALGLKIPDVQVCANHQTPWQAFCAAYFAKNSIILWEASRGFGGKSFMLAALGLVEAQTYKCDVNILGGSGQQSARVHQYMSKFLGRKVQPIREDGIGLLDGEPLVMRTKLSFGNEINALPASENAVRGPHVPRLRMDEIDEMDLTILDSALGQPMTINGVDQQTVFSSTHHNADGTYTEIKKRAKEKQWPHFAWCYKETMEPHGWLSARDVEQKRHDITAAMWKAEYDLQEPTPESRAILQDMVDACFKEDLGVYEGRNGEYIEMEPPVIGAEYVHGADWARTQDWTEIVTRRIDCRPRRIVAYERMQRKPWPVMVAKLDARIDRYGGRAAHDATGLGDVVEGYLRHDVVGVQFGGKIRAEIFNAWIVDIEAMETEAPRIEALYGQHKYVSSDDLYGTGHPPDGFVACALAKYAETADTVRVL